MEALEVLETIQRDGYEVRKQLVRDGEFQRVMEGAYTSRGDYVGLPEVAEELITKRGIDPIKRYPDSYICTIGYCEKDKKWYGWSHRAIMGFGVGYEVGDENYDMLGYYPSGYRVQTLTDARQMAEKFADSVA